MNAPAHVSELVELDALGDMVQALQRADQEIGK